MTPDGRPDINNNSGRSSASELRQRLSNQREQQRPTPDTNDLRRQIEQRMERGDSNRPTERPGSNRSPGIDRSQLEDLRQRFNSRTQRGDDSPRDSSDIRQRLEDLRNNGRPGFEPGDRDQRPDRNPFPGRDQRPDSNDRPDLGDRPDRGGRPGPGDRPDGNDRPDMGNRPDLGDRPNRGDGPDFPGRPGDGNRPDVGDRPGDGNRPDRGNPPGDADRPDRGGRPGDGDRPDRGDRPGDTDRPDRDGRPDFPGRPGDGDRDGRDRDRPGDDGDWRDRVPGRDFDRDNDRPGRDFDNRYGNRRDFDRDWNNQTLNYLRLGNSDLLRQYVNNGRRDDFFRDRNFRLRYYEPRGRNDYWRRYHGRSDFDRWGRSIARHVLMLRAAQLSGYRYDNRDYLYRDYYGRPLGIYYRDYFRPGARFIVPHFNRYYRGSYYCYGGSYYYYPETYATGPSSATVSEPVEMQFGGFDFVADLAHRFERMANDICLDMHYNYRGNPDFDSVYRDAYTILSAAKEIERAAEQGNQQEAADLLYGLDQLFYYVYDQTATWERREQKQVGDGDLMAKFSINEAVLQHLMYNVGVEPSFDVVDETAPQPENGGVFTTP